MDATYELTTAGVVTRSTLTLALDAPLAAFVVWMLSAGHAQTSGFQSRIPFPLASGVACADVCGGLLWILPVAGAVGFKVTQTQELAIIEFCGLHPTEAISKTDKAPASGWRDGCLGLHGFGNGRGASCVMWPVQMQQWLRSSRQWYLWQVGQWLGGVTRSRALAAFSMSACRILRTVGCPSARAGSPRASRGGDG